MLRPVAILRRMRDGETFPLAAQCLVGRSSACLIRLDDRYVSSEHAKLVWTGTKWQVRDLGSRNGTFVDGRRVEPGRPVFISVGSQLGFGESEVGWALIDAAPPSAIATSTTDGRRRTAVGELLVLPNDDTPEVSIYPDPEGPGWLVEDVDGETRLVQDQAVLTVGRGAWRLDLPVLSEATPMVDVARTLDNVSLRLAVSSDEERVDISVMLRGEVIDTLEPREHSYLLLTLARARLEDASLAPSEQGWRDVDTLTRMLKLDANALNVSIHRARQQLASTGLEGAAGVVQTRRGRRRLGTSRFEVVRLED